jgi:hypothetical protein
LRARRVISWRCSAMRPDPDAPAPPIASSAYTPSRSLQRSPHVVVLCGLRQRQHYQDYIQPARAWVAPPLISPWQMLGTEEQRHGYLRWFAQLGGRGSGTNPHFQLAAITPSFPCTCMRSPVLTDPSAMFPRAVARR